MSVDEHAQIAVESESAEDTKVADPLSSHDIRHPWYFQDDFGQIQGPFTQVEMENWYDAGWPELMVSSEGSDVSAFYPIKDMFGADMEEGDNPFRWDAELQDVFDGNASAYGSIGSVDAEADSADGDPMPSTMWYFRDDAGKAQGCFDTDQMRAWYEAGYFVDTLPIAAVKGEVHPTQLSKLLFFPLSAAFADVEKAFLPTSTRLSIQSLRRHMSEDAGEAKGTSEQGSPTLAPSKSKTVRHLDSTASLRSLLRGCDSPPPGKKTIERSLSISSNRSIDKAKGLAQVAFFPVFGPKQSMSKLRWSSGRQKQFILSGSTSHVYGVNDAEDAFAPLPPIARSTSTPKRKTTLTLEKWATVAKIQHKLSMRNVVEEEEKSATPSSRTSNLSTPRITSTEDPAPIMHAKTFSTFSGVSGTSRHRRNDSAGPRWAVAPRKVKVYCAQNRQTDSKALLGDARGFKGCG